MIAVIKTLHSPSNLLAFYFIQLQKIIQKLPMPQWIRVVNPCLSFLLPPWIASRTPQRAVFDKLVTFWVSAASIHNLADLILVKFFSRLMEMIIFLINREGENNFWVLSAHAQITLIYSFIHLGINVQQICHMHGFFLDNSRKFWVPHSKLTWMVIDGSDIRMLMLGFPSLFVII